MIFQKTYQFKEWTKWSSMMPSFIEDFQTEFSYYPNILQANKHTLSQFDFLATIDPEETKNVHKINDYTNQPEEIESHDKIVLTEYKWRNVSLEFTVDDSLANMTLRLIYDSDPGWDDDPPANPTDKLTTDYLSTIC
jgi:hypothetical protein